MKKIVSYVLIALSVLTIVWGLSVEPSDFIKEVQTGWIIPRFVALVLSIVLGLTTYYVADLGKSLKAVVDDIKYYKQDKKASNSISEFLNNVSALAWTSAWIIGFQAMVTFYVADWCKFGF